MSETNTILLVGDYPPPYGGVSVQVSVLQRLLSAMPGITCRVLDIGKSRRQRRLGCLSVHGPFDFVWKLLSHAARQHTIHLHTNGHNLKSWLVSLTCAAAGMVNRRKTVVSIGSGFAPDFIEKASSGTRVLIRSALTLTGAVICRNERAKIAIMSLGLPAEKIVINWGFYGVRTEQLGHIPQRIEKFLQNHSPTVAAMASLGPEYGISLLIEVATRLRPLYPRLGVILIGPGGIEDHDLDAGFLVTGELSHDVVLGAMRKINVFVRPTYFDGDASSVREALALGVPVVASDTDFRPDGVILFRCGDVRDLSEKIAYALADGHTADARSQSVEAGSLEQLLAIYGRLGKRRPFRGGPA